MYPPRAPADPQDTQTHRPPLTLLSVKVPRQFDPELHEAVDTIEVEPERDGIVTSEYSRGYKIGDRLIKPARVQVGRSKEGVRQLAAE